MPAALSLLHTSPSHVERFERLLAEQAPTTPVRHVVNEALLSSAAAGDHESVLELVEQELLALAAISAVVLCTCSTLGPLAERFDGVHSVRVVRIDRPMAHQAVRSGTRLAVIATAPSTVDATMELLNEEAERAGLESEPTVSLVDGAWERFRAGDQEGYLRLVGEQIARDSAGADVVVLAQASMQGAERYASVRVPVLSSPATGLAHALGLLQEEDRAS